MGIICVRMIRQHNGVTYNILVKVVLENKESVEGYYAIEKVFKGEIINNIDRSGLMKKLEKS